MLENEVDYEAKLNRDVCVEAVNEVFRQLKDKRKKRTKERADEWGHV